MTTENNEPQGGTMSDAELISSVRDVVSQAVDSSLSGKVEQAVKPIADKLAELEGTVTELKKPQSQSGKNASVLFGAPAVRTGESVMSSRGYRFSALFAAIASQDWSNAKVEREVHNQLHEAYGSMSGESGTVLAPLGGAHLQRVDAKLASEIQQLVRQGVAGADADHLRWSMRRVNQDFSTFDDTAGAALLGSVQQGELIDLLRAKEVISQAGAREFTLPPNGRIGFPRHTAGAAAYWVGESDEIPESTQATGMLPMAAKKLAAITDMPNEMLRFATASIEAFVRDQMAKDMANKLDQTLLTGTGSEVAPKGLINYSGIKTHVASVLGDDGNTLMPEDLAILAAMIEEENINTDGIVMAMRPRLHAAVTRRRADAVSAADQKGPYLVFNSSPNDIEGVRSIRSTNIPNDREKGASSALTMVLMGVFDEYLLGRVGAVEFDMNKYSNTNFRNDMTSIRAIQHVDGKPRREEAFGIIDDLVIA